MTARKPGAKRRRKPSTAGDRLRAAIVAEFELSEAEGLLLEKAAATATLLERVEGEVATAPLLASGSRRQPVPNPLIGAQVELGAHLVRLLAALNVPLGEEDPEAALVSRQARRAAMVRWHERAG